MRLPTSSAFADVLKVALTDCFTRIRRAGARPMCGLQALQLWSWAIDYAVADIERME